MVTASQQSDNTYSYNTLTVVLLTETAKLFASIVLSLKCSTYSALVNSFQADRKLLVLYMVPSFLYYLYNNLAFYNLEVFDPTTYFVLLQLRAVVTGVIFQVIFKKQLTVTQWISLVILTTGCILKQTTAIKKALSPTAFNYSFRTLDIFNVWRVDNVLIYIQIVSSCLGGICNEKLLKDTGAQVNIHIQNVFMYFDSVLWNIVFLFFMGQYVEAVSYASLQQVFQKTVIIIILNNAAVGIVTSFFLQNLNSILKTFASALELVFTAILSWIFFAIAVDVWTVASLFMVIYATFLYSKNPVVNRGRLDERKVANDEDECHHSAKSSNLPV